MLGFEPATFRFDKFYEGVSRKSPRPTVPGCLSISQVLGILLVKILKKVKHVLRREHKTNRCTTMLLKQLETINFKNYNRYRVSNWQFADPEPPCPTQSSHMIISQIF